MDGLYPNLIGYFKIIGHLVDKSLEQLSIGFQQGGHGFIADETERGVGQAVGFIAVVDRTEVGVLANGGTRVDNAKQCGISGVVPLLDADGAIDNAVDPAAGMILAVDLFACSVSGRGSTLSGIVRWKGSHKRLTCMAWPRL